MDNARIKIATNLKKTPPEVLVNLVWGKNEFFNRWKFSSGNYGTDAIALSRGLVC